MKLKKWGLSLALTVLGAGAVLATPTDDLAQWEARLQKIQERLEEAQKARSQAYRAAETDAERMAALEMDPWASLDESARMLAEEAAGTEVAAQAWSLVFLNSDPYQGDQEDRWDVFLTLTSDHADSDSLIPVVESVAYSQEAHEPAVRGLKALVEVTKQDRTKAASYLSLAKMLEKDEKTRQQAVAYYRLVVSDFAKQKHSRGSTYASMASASIYEAEHLQVGQPVPDFQIVDEANASFKLSDYKGKVVLLDFWGFW